MTEAPALPMRSDAVISADGRYRYRLTRDWSDAPTGARPDQILAFLMLNPSTADHTTNDPTIRRCIGFALRDGFMGVVAVNLYAFRASKPKVLWKEAAELRIGSENDYYLRATAMHYPKIVAAWGAQAPGQRIDRGWHRFRITAVRELFKEMQAPLLCLGLTEQGEPRHPLMVRADAPLMPYL